MRTSPDSQCFPATRVGRRRGLVEAVGEHRRVARAVEQRPRVVGDAAVDRDVRDRLARRLDDADAVERHAAAPTSERPGSSTSSGARQVVQRPGAFELGERPPDERTDRGRPLLAGACRTPSPPPRSTSRGVQSSRLGTRRRTRPASRSSRGAARRRGPASRDGRGDRRRRAPASRRSDRLARLLGAQPELRAEVAGADRLVRVDLDPRRQAEENRPDPGGRRAGGSSGASRTTSPARLAPPPRAPRRSCCCRARRAARRGPGTERELELAGVETSAPTPSSASRRSTATFGNAFVPYTIRAPGAASRYAPHARGSSPRSRRRAACRAPARGRSRATPPMREPTVVDRRRSRGRGRARQDCRRARRLRDLLPSGSSARRRRSAGRARDGRARPAAARSPLALYEATAKNLLRVAIELVGGVETRRVERRRRRGARCARARQRRRARVDRGVRVLPLWLLARERHRARVAATSRLVAELKAAGARRGRRGRSVDELLGVLEAEPAAPRSSTSRRSSSLSSALARGAAPTPSRSDRRARGALRGPQPDGRRERRPLLEVSVGVGLAFLTSRGTSAASTSRPYARTGEPSRSEGFAAYARRVAKPYRDAVAGHFDPARRRTRSACSTGSALVAPPALVHLGVAGARRGADDDELGALGPASKPRIVSLCTRTASHGLSSRPRRRA